eukprot:3133984-Lingulodinium_polyedra.AAC.1
MAARRCRASCRVAKTGGIASCGAMTGTPSSSACCAPGSPRTSISSARRTSKRWKGWPTAL